MHIGVGVGPLPLLAAEAGRYDTWHSRSDCAVERAVQNGSDCEGLEASETGARGADAGAGETEGSTSMSAGYSKGATSTNWSTKSILSLSVVICKLLGDVLSNEDLKL